MTTFNSGGNGRDPAKMRVIRSARFASLWGALLFLAGLIAAPAASQTVRGVLVDGESQEPIGGVLVVLHDAKGARRRAALTDDAGRFVLRAPVAGSYTVRTERIGYQPTVSQPLALRPGETRDIRLVGAAEAVALEGITVEGSRRRCRIRPQSGAETALLWEEARKALEVASWTRERRLFRYTVVQRERDVDLRTGQTSNEASRDSSAVAAVPFASLPAAELAENGYVQQRQDGTWYYAPDADVLLSDDFLDQHCFWVRIGRGGERGLVGLAFEPVGGRTLPDVAGVLWVDRAAAELRRLEFDYVNLPQRVPPGAVGGRVEFARLPNGAWMVPRWWIRMPAAIESADRGNEMLRASGRAGARVSRVHQFGGEVVAVAVPREKRGVEQPLAAAADTPAPGSTPPANPAARPAPDAAGGSGRAAPTPPALPADSVIRLEGLVATGERRPRNPRLRAFYDRAERSTGFFVTREQIAARPGARFTDLLRAMPNLYLVPAADGGYTPRMSRNVSSITDADCPPIYYLDGVPHPVEGSPDGKLPVQQIEGIEVYAGAAIPAQFTGSRARCGVIAVWTRER